MKLRRKKCVIIFPTLIRVRNYQMKLEKKYQIVEENI